MKLLKVSLCAAVAVASMAFANAASAEVTFNAGAATDYMFRGVRNSYDSHQGNAPEVFGGVDWSGGPMLYAGAWISNTGQSNDNGIEIDYYGGWKPAVGPISLDLGVIYYTYNDSDNGSVLNDFNTLEWKLAGSIAAGPATIGGAVFYTDDAASSGNAATYYELNIAFPIKDKVTFSAAIGEQTYDTSGPYDSYTTWNAGVTLPITDKVSFDARYIGTDNDATVLFGNLAAGDSFVATIKGTF
ncbi:TorF family putative porin [soil metagenome]